MGGTEGRTRRPLPPPTPPPPLPGRTPLTPHPRVRHTPPPLEGEKARHSRSHAHKPRSPRKSTLCPSFSVAAVETPGFSMFPSHQQTGWAKGASFPELSLHDGNQEPSVPVLVPPFGIGEPARGERGRKGPDPSSSPIAPSGLRGRRAETSSSTLQQLQVLSLSLQSALHISLALLVQYRLPAG